VRGGGGGGRLGVFRGLSLVDAGGRAEDVGVRELPPVAEGIFEMGPPGVVPLSSGGAIVVVGLGGPVVLGDGSVLGGVSPCRTDTD
jgi:hypothetical protein